MSSQMTMIDGVAQLTQEMLRDVEKGKIQLSADDWAELDSKLVEAGGLLEKDQMSGKREGQKARRARDSPICQPRRHAALLRT